MVGLKIPWNLRNLSLFGLGDCYHQRISFPNYAAPDRNVFLPVSSPRLAWSFLPAPLGSKYLDNVISRTQILIPLIVPANQREGGSENITLESFHHRVWVIGWQKTGTYLGKRGSMSTTSRCRTGG